MRLIGFYNYTVVLTYISLISSLVGMRFAYVGKIGLAIACLAFSGFCDMFDGVVARTKKNRTNDEKNFGIQLDSLCDVVCFGVLPAVILYFCGVNTVYGIAILVFYALCAVIRLAFKQLLGIIIFLSAAKEKVHKHDLVPQLSEGCSRHGAAG